MRVRSVKGGESGEGEEGRVLKQKLHNSLITFDVGCPGLCVGGREQEMM